MIYSALRNLSIFLLAVTSLTVFAKTQKVILHLNGYKGNIAYTTRVPGSADPDYFYVTNKEGDTTLELTETADGKYGFDNAARLPDDDVKKVPGSFITIVKTGGKFELEKKWQADAVELSETKDGISKEPIPVITFKTCTVKINSAGLTYPYMFSPFELIKGRTTVLGAQFHYVRGDLNVMLIKGMSYQIDNTCFNSVFFDGRIRNTFFSIEIDKDGMVRSFTPEAAIGNKNMLTFKTGDTVINPGKLQGYVSGGVKVGNNNEDKRGNLICKITKISIFKYLSTILSWTDSARMPRTCAIHG